MLAADDATRRGRPSPITATNEAEKRAALAARRVGAKQTLERLDEAPAEAPAPITARLRIKIRHWANVRIDGKETRHVVNKAFELGVGRHELEIVWPGAGPVPAGRFEKRAFVVDERGALFEVRDGRNVASPGTIEVRIPANRDEGDTTAGWRWNS